MILTKWEVAIRSTRTLHSIHILRSASRRALRMRRLQLQWSVSSTSSAQYLTRTEDVHHFCRGLVEEAEGLELCEEGNGKEGRSGV